MSVFGSSGSFLTRIPSEIVDSIVIIQQDPQKIELSTTSKISRVEILDLELVEGKQQYCLLSAEWHTDRIS